jgi:hypothetical protein
MPINQRGNLRPFSLLERIPDPYIRKYIERTWKEMRKLFRDQFNGKRPKITTLIYGHTHISGIASPEKMLTEKSKTKIHTMNAEHMAEHRYNTVNTGGWLRKSPTPEKQHFEGYGDPCGATVPSIVRGRLEKVYVVGPEAKK